MAFIDIIELRSMGGRPGICAMERAVAAHERQDAVDQLLAAEVANVAQRESAAQVGVAVREQPGQVSGHSRVISIESIGLCP